MIERVTFDNGRGLLLVSSLVRPDAVRKPPIVVLVHDRGSEKTSAPHLRIARGLEERGIATLLLDLSGQGESEGDPSRVVPEDQVEDLRVAIDRLVLRGDLGPVGLAGLGSGAAIVLAEAVDDPRVEALALASPGAEVHVADAGMIQVPTLVIQRAGDPLAARNVELAAQLRGSSLVTVPVAADLVADERGLSAVSAEISPWFLRHLTSGGGEGGRVPGTLRILSEDGFGTFLDRSDAGHRLASALASETRKDAVVVALPRGGVVIGDVLAEALGGELDVLVVGKLRTPGYPELAMGAIAEGDVVVWNEDVLASLGVTEQEQRVALDTARAALARKAATYRAVAPQIPVTGRRVVLTDDGVATGATLRAALVAIALQKPARIVVALPGGPGATLEALLREPSVDEVVAVVCPSHFVAVSQLYGVFEPVSRGEVVQTLRRARQRRRAIREGGIALA